MSAVPAQVLEPAATPGPAACGVFIVFNPGSGSQDKDGARQAIADMLEAAGRPHRFIAIESGDVQKAYGAKDRIA